MSGWREPEPVAHEGEGEHTHAHSYGGDPDSIEPFEPDPDVRAYVTTVTVVIAHPNTTSPPHAVALVTKALEAVSLEGVVVGVASVELKGRGGLIGL